MLHGALPRACLAPAAPGPSYLDGYYEPYAVAIVHQQQHQHHLHHLQQQQHHLSEDSYGRATKHQIFAWSAPAFDLPAPKSGLVCPLDLSLKPAPPRPPTPGATPGATPGRPDDCCEAIEVDDEEDRRSREEARSQHSYPGYPGYPRSDEDELVVDDLESQRSYSSGHSQPASGWLRVADEHDYRQQQLQQLLQTPRQPQQQQQPLHAPMTPPSTPSPPQCHKRKQRPEEEPELTPAKARPEKPGRAKKKPARKLKFNEDTSSPVSGTIILGPDEVPPTADYDIDLAFDFVEVTEKARAELAKIENRLGPYQCKLCCKLHEDAFQLAQHRCSRIVHVEYRCTECDKVFTCPANLASHKRWHKPKPDGSARPKPKLALGPGSEHHPPTSSPAELQCSRCDAKFGRQAALRKHLAARHPEHEQQEQEEEEAAAPAGPEVA